VPPQTGPATAGLPPGGPSITPPGQTSGFFTTTGTGGFTRGITPIPQQQGAGGSVPEEGGEGGMPAWGWVLIALTACVCVTILAVMAARANMAGAIQGAAGGWGQPQMGGGGYQAYIGNRSPPHFGHQNGIRGGGIPMNQLKPLPMNHMKPLRVNPLQSYAPHQEPWNMPGRQPPLQGPRSPQRWQVGAWQQL